MCEHVAMKLDDIVLVDGSFCFQGLALWGLESKYISVLYSVLKLLCYTTGKAAITV